MNKINNRKYLGVTAAALGLITISGITNLGSQTVYADKAEMVGLPGGVSATGAKYSGQYAFHPAVQPGITKTIPFGGTGSNWATTTTHTENMTKHWDVFNIGSALDSAGKVGMLYSNVGKTKGHTLDMTITLMSAKISNYKWVDNPDKPGHQMKKPLPAKDTYVAFGTDDFEIFTPGSGAIKYRLDFYDHDTGQPVKISGQWSFNDIDANQWLGLNSMSKIDNTYWGDRDKNSETWLDAKKIDGTQYIYSDANKHNTEIDDDRGHNEGTVTSSMNKAKFFSTYSNASNISFTWVYGDNTGNTAITSQKELLDDDSYWNLPPSDFDPDARNNQIKKIYNSVDNSVINHAYLQFGGKAIVPDKPYTVDKYVSDGDEGTNAVNEIGGPKSVKHDLLQNRYENYHYQLVEDVPDVMNEFKYNEFQIKDKIDKDLDVSNIHVYNAANQDVTYEFTTLVDDANTLKVIAKPDTLKSDDFYNEQYKITFDAKVKPGVSLADHKDTAHPDQAVIDNGATITTENGSADSDKTTTNIPFTKESAKKFVSVNGTGNDTALTVDFGKDYQYRVDTVAPDNVDLTSLELKDKLEDVLDLKDAKVLDADDSDKDVTDQGTLSLTDNTVDWKPKDASKWAGKHFKILITADVKSGSNLADYMVDGEIKIPNKADWSVNGEKVPTNKVDVTPTTPKPSATKKIEVEDDTGISGKSAKVDSKSNAIEKIASFAKSLFNK